MFTAQQNSNDHKLKSHSFVDYEKKRQSTSFLLPVEHEDKSTSDSSDESFDGLDLDETH